MKKWVIAQKLVQALWKEHIKVIDNSIIKTVFKIYKPPSITVCDVNDIQNLVTNLTREKTPGHEQQLRTFANDDIKILTDAEHQFRRTLKVLENNKSEFHRYQFKAEKKSRVVIRGLHPKTEICEIKRELADKSFSACDVLNIQIKKKLNLNDKNSDKNL